MTVLRDILGPPVHDRAVSGPAVEAGEAQLPWSYPDDFRDELVVVWDLDGLEQPLEGLLN